MHNWDLDAVHWNKKLLLTWLWLEGKVLHSAPSLRLNSVFFLAVISFIGKVANCLNLNIFICKMLFAHSINNVFYSSGDK